MKKIAALIGFDRDVGYALASRIVTASLQLVTLALVALLMSAEVQGYHFTFISFAALLAFFELGFYVVVVNTAAHEWAHLSLAPDGRLTGPERPLDRLASLLRFSIRWYGYVSIAFVIVALVAGGLFFTSRPQTGVDWQTPWVFFVLAAGLLIWGNSALYFLEGCGQIAESYRIRLIAAVLGQTACWLVLLSGAELWVAVTAIGIGAAAQIILAAWRHFALFQSLLVRRPAQGMSWRMDLWPLQWRMALQGIAGSFCFSIFAPVAFYYHGPVTAGRIGVTWAIASGILSVMNSWVQVRAPRLAALIAQGNDEELHALFGRTLRASLGILLATLAVVWAGLTGIHVAGLEVAARFLPPAATAWLFGGVLLLQVSTTMSVYLRAHKTDPSALTNTAAAIAAALTVWAAGAFYGTTAMAMGYFLAIALLLIPCQTAIFFRYRKRQYPSSPAGG